MVVKINLIAEIEADSAGEALDKLDAFRESVLPSENYGITLVRDVVEPKDMIEALKAQGNLIIGIVGDPAAGNPSTKQMESAVDAAFANLLKSKSIAGLAAVIARDWKNVNFGAVPYLDAMRSLENISDTYGADSGKSIVAYFLCNAKTWKGDTAKAVKAELKRRIK
jgi:hypothetical protein